MAEVWKFPLAYVGEQNVSMPDFAELLHVAEQDGRLCLWARVGRYGEAPNMKRTILVRGTGHPVGNEAHVGSLVARNGFVWHVFDGGTVEVEA